MGLAHLSDGTTMDYRVYIATHPYWQKVRKARLQFDNYQCVVCHRDITSDFETHHLNYSHLGSEHLTDVITLCPKCHAAFHNNWRKNEFWKGRESGHWQAFDLGHTARLCAEYYKDDIYICKDMRAPNLCNKDTQRIYIDRYLREHDIKDPVPLDPNDLGLFVRNKRYELFFEAEDRGLTVEEFLDEYFGPKIRGKNPLRTMAGKSGSTFDHEAKSFHRHYKENKNITLLMEEVKKIENQEEFVL